VGAVIKRPLDVEWEEFGKVLHDLRFKTVLACNYTIQLYWEWDKEKFKYKEEYGNFPSEKDVFGMTFRNYVYHKLREKFSEVSSANISQIQQAAMKLWKKELPEIRKLKASVPSVKLGYPILVYNKNYEIRRNKEGRFVVKLTLYSKEKEKTRFEILLDKLDKSKKAILDRIISGEYKQGVLQIRQIKKKKKKKWMCIFSYSFVPDKRHEFIKDRVMGIDLGINYTAYCALNDDPKPRYPYKGGEIKEFNRRLKKRKISIQKSGGKTGHGRKRKLLPVEIFSGRIKNYRNTINHKIAKRIVDKALKFKVAKIHLEDLSEIGEDTGNTSFFLENWPYYDLQQKIKYKAEREGIEVCFIDPKNTSIKCSKCGYIDKENRDKEKFKCKKCGFEAHADYNAARNIAMSVDYVS